MSKDDVAALTPFQPVGPYFHVMLRDAPLRATSIAGPDVPGLRVTIEGAVLDGAGAPVADALVEIWQADAAGRYPDAPASTGSGGGPAPANDDGEDHVTAGPNAAVADRPADPPSFTGYGRVATDREGRFTFATIRPGRVRDGGGPPQAPHLLLAILAPGILTRYWTRIYFADDAANASDAILRLVPAARRKTLIARAAADGLYHFRVVLQGEDETVFFDA